MTRAEQPLVHTLIIGGLQFVKLLPADGKVFPFNGTCVFNHVTSDA